MVLGRALCELCGTRYFGKAFLSGYMYLCRQRLGAQTFCAQCFLCKRFVSDSKSFLACRQAEMSWGESKEMGKVDQCSDEMKTAEKS